MTKISVIIPAYNAMAYLPETIENVLKQTHEDFEVIVVNDGSSDQTPEWVAQVPDPRIKLISQENTGQAKARNTGIAYAKGEYIAFLDADDLWEPTKLKKQLECLEKDQTIGLVYTWVAFMDEQGKETGRIFKSTVQGQVWDTLIQQNILVCGSVPMVRRTCFQTCGVFDPELRSFNEDWDMWLRIASSYPFAVVPEVLVYYRQHPLSSSRDWKAMAQGYQIVIEKAFTSAPSELQYLKSKSYGRANFSLAWKPLQCLEKDCQMSFYFRKIAIEYDPMLWWTKEYWRLSLALFLMAYLGTNRYNILLKILYRYRWFVKKLFNNVIIRKKIFSSK